MSNERPNALPLPTYREVAVLFGWATAALPVRILRGLFDLAAPRRSVGR